MVGLDGHRRPHLLLRTEGGGEIAPADIATLDVTSRTLELETGSAAYLDVACLFESVAEVFEHFVVAVLDRLARSGDPPQVALASVLENWRQFLTPAEGPPGREKLAALVAELLVVVDLAQVSPGTALDAWVGPYGGRHDFRRQTLGIEVKSTRAHTARRVTIHGEDQLEPPAGGQLYLHLVRLEQVAGAGHSVASIVDALLASGAAVELLFDSLAAAGLPAADLAASADIRFEVRERLTVPIDYRAPRIVPASFIGGARPPGVVDLTYVIDLDHMLDRALDSAAYDALIARIAAPLS